MVIGLAAMVYEPLYHALQIWQEYASGPKENITKGLFTWREEDPRGRIILAPYVFSIQFTCKILYLAVTLGSSKR